MTVQTYRKKPVEIQAIRWTGENFDEIAAWTDRGLSDGFGVNVDTKEHELWVAANKSWLPVETGEWIAKDRHGFYPIKDDVFRESYELA